jgi:hypothetical protein
MTMGNLTSNCLGLLFHSLSNTDCHKSPCLLAQPKGTQSHMQNDKEEDKEEKRHVWDFLTRNPCAL